MTSSSSQRFSDEPNQLNEWLWVFSPNKNSFSTTSWWLDCGTEPVLIDCPALTSSNLSTLKKLSEGKTPKIILTNRKAHSSVSELKEALGCKVLIQEQEAYLLPQLNGLETFQDEINTVSGLKLLWTPGPTPGSCIVFAPEPWNVLFCGRLLIPVKFGELASIRHETTFHWAMQQKSLTKLRDWLPREANPQLASGANLSLLMPEVLLKWEAWKYITDDHKTK